MQANLNCRINPGKRRNCLHRQAVWLRVTTDSPVIPQQYLPLCAGLAVQAGMDHYEALKAITVNPAKILGLDGRIGSLEEGKDADIVVARAILYPIRPASAVC